VATVDQHHKVQEVGLADLVEKSEPMAETVLQVAILGVTTAEVMVVTFTHMEETQQMD